METKENSENLEKLRFKYLEIYKQISDFKKHLKYNEIRNLAKDKKSRSYAMEILDILREASDFIRINEQKVYESYINSDMAYVRPDSKRLNEYKMGVLQTKEK